MHFVDTANLKCDMNMDDMNKCEDGTNRFFIKGKPQLVYVIEGKIKC